MDYIHFFKYDFFFVAFAMLFLTLVKILIKRVRLVSMSTQITRASTGEIVCVFIFFVYSNEYLYALCL